MQGATPISKQILTIGNTKKFPTIQLCKVSGLKKKAALTCGALQKKSKYFGNFYKYSHDIVKNLFEAKFLSILTYIIVRNIFYTMYFSIKSDNMYKNILSGRTVKVVASHAEGCRANSRLRLH